MRGQKKEVEKIRFRVMQISCSIKTVAAVEIFAWVKGKSKIRFTHTHTQIQ